MRALKAEPSALKEAAALQAVPAPRSKKTGKRKSANGKGEMIRRLNASFETFIGVTEELKEAYDKLRERAASMDLELQDANRRLSEKVRELDGLTRRLNSLLQGLPSAVVAVDEKGTIVHFNRAAEQLLGVSGAGVLGKPLGEAAALDGLVLLKGGAGAAAGERQGEERRVTAPGGRTLVLVSRIAKLKDGKGRSAGAIEILSDLTETDRLRREVHRLDTLAALGEMAGAVAHQIRNPLNGVEGFASLLLRQLCEAGRTDADSRRFARKIVEGVREVNAVIHGMLMLARSEPLCFRPMELDPMLEAIAQTAASGSEGGAAVAIRFLPGLAGKRLLLDGLMLRQVFLNLVHNALQALPPSGRREIRIRTRPRRGGASVRIADSGCGLSPADAAKVFRPFFTTREEGTGLGLAVASKIVSLHGGTMRVRSRPGRATCFEVFLPDRAGAPASSARELGIE